MPSEIVGNKTNVAPLLQGLNFIPGSDTEGRQYDSAEDMWKHELQKDPYDREEGWYGKSLTYWEKTPATISGMLGGMEHVHDAEIQESRNFILRLPNRGTVRALDCGAGIGRITKYLLSELYDVCDVLEPVPHLLEKAKENLAGLPVDQFVLSSMEKASLPHQTYDLIVIQWAAIYLTDTDFVKFFSHCKQALTPQGYIFFKENCITGPEFLVDKEDSSLTRTDQHYKQLFKAAGVRVIREAYQQNWPKNLFRVKMYALC